MNSIPEINNRISIVIPVFRSAESLEILVTSLITVLKRMNRRYEIILVDDCSPDNSWNVLKTLKMRYEEDLKIVRLLVNSGQHNAILCGFNLSSGNVVVTMDDDLQNPPEEISKLIEGVDKGFDLVIGAYDSKKHTTARNLAGRMFDKLLKWIFGLPRNFQLTSFRATKGQVAKRACQMGGVFPYITAMLLSNSATYKNVYVRHDPRPFGRSNYTLKRSFLLAFNLIFSYSSYPLFFVGALCLFAFFVSIILGTITAYSALVYGTSVPGWASTVVIVSFFNGFIMLCLVIFGVYISRLSQQITRTRQPYTVSEIYE
jgi:polyisoprenyl-phosphate glycosyltransferase